METELQRSPSPEYIQQLSPETVPSVSERRNTRGKDVSSSYSSLIPKGRDKTTISNEPTVVLEPPTNNESDHTVLLFCILRY